MGMMQQINLQQGTEAWLDNRLRAFNASEAPVMMGVHPNMRRDELLEAKATCNPKEYSSFVTDRIFAKGHEVEAKARPLLEEVLGEELYPVSGKNGDYQASFDGLNLMFDVGFEHKQWNAELAEAVLRNDPPPYIYWQLEHQMLVCPTLERIILVVSDGTREKWVQMDYYAVPGRREQLIAGWEQFAKDLAEFKPATKVVEPVGVRPESLPALFIEVTGQLATKDNLADFRAGAQRIINSIKTELVTDQDFADAEATVKFLAESEERIDAHIEAAMSRTGPLEELVRTLRDVQQNLLRATRLKLAKQIEAQKLNRRNQIVSDASGKFNAFLEGVNAEFGSAGVVITLAPDFYGAIKGKRNFDLMVSNCNDLIARSKIEVNEIAGRVRKNLALLAEYSEYDFLFPDKQQLAFMDHEHLKLAIKDKVNSYVEQERAKEAKRIQHHQNVVTSLEAACEFDDSVSYGALVTTRQRIAAIEVADLQEFTERAAALRKEALRRLDARIQELEQRRDEVQSQQLTEVTGRAAAVEPAKPVQAAAPIQHDAIPGHDDMDVEIHAAAQEPPPPSSSSKPSDLEILHVLADHYHASPAKVLNWLAEFDFVSVGRQLAA